MPTSKLDDSLDTYLFHRELRPWLDARVAGVRGTAAPRGIDVVIPATDRAFLAGRVYRAVHEPQDVVVIAPATGVKQSYYAVFASWLAKRGFDVVTFDYRGIGGSREAAPEPTMLDWGSKDLAGVVAWAAKRSRSRSVALVTHSVGGQLVGFLPNPETVRAIVTVGSQSGDYRLWPLPARLTLAFMWHAVVPSVICTVGYLPGALGTGEDLPSGVAGEWARWCRTPGYFAGVDGPANAETFGRVRAPILAFGFDDDTYAPRAAVDALHALYTGSTIERRQIHRGTSLGKIGHFGFFRRRFEDTLWVEAAAFLDRSSR